MNHVTAIVGGYNTQQRHIGQIGPRFMLMPKAKQAEAVKFLNDNAFSSPTWQIDKDILRKIEPVGALNRIRTAQNSVLTTLLSSTRFARLVEQSALDGVDAYQPADFLADVRGGVWSELSAPKVTVDAYRRNLQRAYLDIANTKVNAPAQAAPQGLPAGFAPVVVTSGDERAFYRAELRAINAAATSALARSSDKATRAHLESVRDQVGKILNPEGGRATGTAFNEEAVRLLELYQNPTSCWPDYVIKP